MPQRAFMPVAEVTRREVADDTPEVCCCDECLDAAHRTALDVAFILMERLGPSQGLAIITDLAAHVAAAHFNPMRH